MTTARPRVRGAVDRERGAPLSASVVGRRHPESDAPVRTVANGDADPAVSGMLLADARGVVVHANAAAGRALGDPTDLRGRHLTDLVVGDDPGLLEPDLERVRITRCTLQRSFVVERGVTTRRLDVRVDALGAATGPGFVVKVVDRGDVLGGTGLRRLLTDLAGQDPARVVLLLNRSLRCTAVFGAGAQRLGVDLTSLHGFRIGAGLPVALRDRLVASYPAAVAGTTTSFTVPAPDGRSRILVDVCPLTSDDGVDGVVVTCRLVEEIPADGDDRAGHVDRPPHVDRVNPRPELRVGRVSVDLVTRYATVEGSDPVRLTGREAELLCDLLRHAGRARSREQLLASVWGIDFPTSTSVIDVTVHRLRSKLRLPELETLRSNGLLFRVSG